MAGKQTSTAARERWESSHIGPSHIKVQFNLSRTLWPVSWMAASPAFTSCLLSDQPGTVPSRRLRSSSQPALDEAAASASSVRSPRIVVPIERGPGSTWPNSPVGPGSARLREGGASVVSPAPGRKRRRTESMEMGDIGGDMQNSDADPAMLYASSVAIDLQSAPIRGDSWLTSSLIDAILFKLSIAYPDVHFLPCDFQAWDLPKAAKNARDLVSFVPMDMLRRPVKIISDLDAMRSSEASGPTCVPSRDLPPMRNPPDWYDPLPTCVPEIECNNRSEKATEEVSVVRIGPKNGTVVLAHIRNLRRDTDASTTGIGPFALLPSCEVASFLADPQAYLHLLMYVIDLARGSLGVSPASLTANGVEGVQGMAALKVACKVAMGQLVGPSHTPLVDIDAVVAVYTAAAAAMFAASSAASASGAQEPPRRVQPPRNGTGADAESRSQRSDAVPMPRDWAGKLSETPLPPSLGTYRAPQYTSQNKPLIFLWHERANHWVTVAVHTGAQKRIEVYEPMGKPERRGGQPAQGREFDQSHYGWLTAGASAMSSSAASTSSRSSPSAMPVEGRTNAYQSVGLSLRCIPLPLLQWLDAVCPLTIEGGWRAKSFSAITRAHQINGFDCGPAALLYAEKVAARLSAQSICAVTNQTEISAYRDLLLIFLKRLVSLAGASNAASR